MPLFTCITLIRDSFHLSQHVADAPAAALRDHVAALPYDDGEGPFDDELEWLQGVAGGSNEVELLPLTQCKNTWLWVEGARFNPQYHTYIVQTQPEQTT